ncbi:uncharacterized protein Dana_GF21466 [Drosophila ananassae]|uniref:Protein lin-52 homolog n=1 Tax=Drosophila ananassae TaxID=7217 RepID=B3MSG6_DROAN|nr:protein lin-52 homolog [Drosophila ananassae]EDV34721.1 uncharacterized protein Dana_GF21466 [Drosophila ananassae]
MSKPKPSLEAFSAEIVLKSEKEPKNNAEISAIRKTRLSGVEPHKDIKDKPESQEDELISMETLRESPVQWPERFPGMDEFLTMSDTPMYTPSVDFGNNLTPEDMAKIHRLGQLTPEELVEKIKSMHDEIYQLGLREAKEMTRGKLLGIFDRERMHKRQT